MGVAGSKPVAIGINLTLRAHATTGENQIKFNKEVEMRTQKKKHINHKIQNKIIKLVVVFLISVQGHGTPSFI